MPRPPKPGQAEQLGGRVIRIEAAASAMRSCYHQKFRLAVDMEIHSRQHGATPMEKCGDPTCQAATRRLRRLRRVAESLDEPRPGGR